MLHNFDKKLLKDFFKDADNKLLDLQLNFLNTIQSEIITKTKHDMEKQDFYDLGENLNYFVDAYNAYIKGETEFGSIPYIGTLVMYQYLDHMKIKEIFDTDDDNLYFFLSIVNAKLGNNIIETIECIYNEKKKTFLH